jgi:ankyrin repeat protein
MYELHKACLEKKYDEVQRLLESGVNVNEKNENGVTALFLSIKHNNIQMMQLLLKYGATDFW